MKRLKLCSIFLLLICMISVFGACSSTTEIENDIEINLNDSDTHYLKFMENNVEVMRLVVLKGETYDDLKPYFPTLTEEAGYIKYWDGDYNYTEYSHNNQFSVYDEKNLIIEIYAYMVKAN